MSRRQQMMVPNLRDRWSIPPTITSSAAPSIVENTTAVVTVTATGGQTPYVFSISGGADQALLTINASTGALAFVVAPDYYAPGDVGGNNVYNVTVKAASVGGAFATQDVAVTVTSFLASLGSALVWWMNPNGSLFTDAGTTPVASDGDLIYREIDDSDSANVFDQTTSGDRPTYEIGANGKKYRNFVDRLHYQNCSSPSGLPAGNAARSFCVGLKAAAIAANRYVFSYGSANNNLAFALDLNQGGDIRIVGYNNDTTITGLVVATGSWVVLTCTWDGTTLSLKLNNGSAFTATPSAFNTTVGIAQMNRFVDADTGNAMDISHFFMTNTKMTDAELLSAYTFLAAQHPT